MPTPQNAAAPQSGVANSLPAELRVLRQSPASLRSGTSGHNDADPLGAIDILGIANRISESGLAGAAETDLLADFCAECLSAGLPLARGAVALDTLHPSYEGRAFKWSRDKNDGAVEIEYSSSLPLDGRPGHRRSPFHDLLANGSTQMRYRLDDPDLAEIIGQTPMLRYYHDNGMTDMVAFVHRFNERGSIGEMNCCYSVWVTDREDGFAPGDVETLQALVQHLSLAIKSTALMRITRTIADLYLGTDGSRRVLSSSLRRGATDCIRAVIWFSDLRGYTAVTDTAEPDEIFPLLNDYANAVVSAIHGAGGQVLRLVGDGTLAIFPAEDPAEGTRAALAAEAAMRDRITALNAERSAGNRPLTSAYLGLHIGDVYYGNIGTDERMDLTVVGPAVNETSRISHMCRSVEREVVLSSEFVAATAGDQREKLVSVGKFALRGVRRARELFTIDLGD